MNPKLAGFMRDLFVLNERATFFGEWAHGFMSYCAVGATNVGSIIFHYDVNVLIPWYVTLNVNKCEFVAAFVAALD